MDSKVELSNILPQEETQKKKTKHIRAHRKVSKELRKHLELRCSNLLKLARRLKVEKLRKNEQILELKRTLVKQLASQEFQELEKAVMVNSLSNYAQLAKQQASKTAELAASRPDSEKIQDKLLIEDLKKRTKILTIQAEKLRKENSSQSDLVSSTRQLITSLIHKTTEDRQQWHSAQQSLKIEDEEPPRVRRVIQQTSGDLDLVHALTNTMNNELTLFKLEHSKIETSLLKENEELKERIDFLEREKNRLSADLVSLEHAQYEHLQLEEDPSSMDTQQVKKVIGTLV